MRLRSAGVLALLAAVALARTLLAGASADEPVLTPGQIRQFLLTANVVSSHRLDKGITSPWRLTLSNGAVTHDAVFQSVDERTSHKKFANGTVELNYRDSFQYNIAAYELAVLLGIDEMMPVTVERRWNGKTGALSWWIAWKWDESMRLKQKLAPPDPAAWNRQMYTMRLFAQLVSDTDRNGGNVLITEDWKLRMIDFTRAFRLMTDLKAAADLARCDRRLLNRLRQLDEAEVSRVTKDRLTKSEVESLMARRDKIVAHFDQLIAQKGENTVLY